MIKQTSWTVLFDYIGTLASVYSGVPRKGQRFFEEFMRIMQFINK